MKSKKTYKISEMWRVWYRPLPLHATNIGFVSELSFKIFHLEKQANAWSQNAGLVKILAITRADATEFYEGEGLE